MARKVLVADDSVTIQKVVGLTFANEDIELSFVDNGEEAISIARKLRPDLIMADVLMPGRSGYEVCELVKTDPDLRHIPVLLLTGTFEPFDADRCAQVRADGTITKPFESQTLIRQVHELLDRPRSRAAAAPEAAEAPAESIETPGTAPEEPAPSPRADEAVAFEATIGGEEEFDLGPELGPDVNPDLSPGVNDAMNEEIAGPSAEAQAGEGALEFNGDPEAALNREAIDAPEAPAEGEDEGWLSAPEEEAASPPASALPQDEDVWDLSDFEAVDEAQPAENDAQASGEEPDTLWNEAAAEAIDIVESTNLELDNEAAATEAARPGETAARGDQPDPQGAGAPSGPAAESPDRFPEIAGENEFDEFALSPSGATAEAQPGDLDLQEAALPAGGDSDSALTDPAESAPATTGRAVPTGGEMLEELTLEEIAEDEEAQPDVQTPPAARAGQAQEAPLGALSSDKSAAIVRDAVKDAVEKVTWEAFSDLSETVVRAVQEKVEKIAWEVIPQMAETIIKEEIRKLKEGEE